MFYQTQYTDPTTGDVLMQSRWYSPGSGTFRSRDTWAGNLNTPVSLNRYTYAHNNPIRYWDPTGRLPCQNPDSCLQELDQLEKNYAAGTGTGASGTGIYVGLSGNPVTTFCPYNATSCGAVTSSNDPPGPSPLLCPTGCGSASPETTVVPASQALASTANLIERCRRGRSCESISVDQFFDFETALLNFLDEKETRGFFFEGLAQHLGYPFGTADGRTLGPYNVGLPVAQDVWSGHGDGITEFFDLNQTMYQISHPSPIVTPHTDTFVPFVNSPSDRYAPTSGSWPGHAEGPLGRITAGLHIEDLQGQWAVELAEAQRTGQTVAVPVNALEAGLLTYRFELRTVRNYVFLGVEPPGLQGVISGDLAVWLASGLTR